MITKDLLIEFNKYSNKYKWTFNEKSSEFTFQFRLGWFLNHYYDNKYLIDFEVNVKEYVSSKTLKKEIDIILIERENQARHAIELKFIKDPIGYDLSLYKMCEDINFIEELRERGGFSESYVLAFTLIPYSYSSPPKRKTTISENRMNFYKMFREDKRISGVVYGNKGDSIVMRKSYNLEWDDFIGPLKVCLIKI